MPKNVGNGRCIYGRADGFDINVSPRCHKEEVAEKLSREFKLKNVLKSRLFILAALAMVAVGCSGSGSNPVIAANGGVNFEGAEAEPGSVTSDAVVPATGGTSVATTEGEVVIPSGSAPAGSTVSTSDTLAILPAGVGLLGAFNANSTLTVNGVANSGASVGSDGLSDTALGFPVSTEGTPYTLSFPAGTLDTTRGLTVGQFVFSGKWYVFFEPLSFSIPIPTGLTGTIPNNGQNAVGANVVATFLPGCNGRTATLRIVYGGGTGFVLEQTKTIANNRVQFSNLTQDTVNVPNSGVSSVALSVGDL